MVRAHNYDFASGIFEARDIDRLREIGVAHASNMPHPERFKKDILIRSRRTGPRSTCAGGSDYSDLRSQELHAILVQRIPRNFLEKSK